MEALEAYARQGERKRYLARVAAMDPLEFRAHCTFAWTEAERRTLELMRRFGRNVNSSDVRSRRSSHTARDPRSASMTHRRRRSSIVCARIEHRTNVAIRILCPADQRLGPVLDGHSTAWVLSFLDVSSLSKLGRTSKRTMLICGDNTIWRRLCLARDDLRSFEQKNMRVENWRMEYRWRVLKRRQADLWRYNFSQGRVGRMRKIPRPLKGPGYDVYDDVDRGEILFASNLMDSEGCSAISGALGRTIEPSQGVGVRVC